jgi:hypothetical protein
MMARDKKNIAERLLKFVFSLCERYRNMRNRRLSPWWFQHEIHAEIAASI